MQDEETAEPALLAPVEAALDDDLNTPAAIAELHELTSRLNRANDAEKPGLAAALRRAGAFLGLLQDEPDRWLQGARPAAGAPSPAEIEDLIVRRRDARRAKDFAEADRIRDLLAAQGVVLEASPQGTTWRRT